MVKTLLSDAEGHRALLTSKSPPNFFPQEKEKQTPSAGKFKPLNSPDFVDADQTLNPEPYIDSNANSDVQPDFGHASSHSQGANPGVQPDQGSSPSSESDSLPPATNTRPIRSNRGVPHPKYQDYETFYSTNQPQAWSASVAELALINTSINRPHKSHG